MRVCRLVVALLILTLCIFSQELQAEDAYRDLLSKESSLSQSQTDTEKPVAKTSNSLDPFVQRDIAKANAVRTADFEEPITATPFGNVKNANGSSPLETPKRLPTIALASFADEMAADEFFTIEELRKELKDIAWTKGEVKIVPYGMLWGSAIYATERTFPGAYTLFAISPDDQGESTFTLDTRRTRVGLDFTGPQIPFFNGAKSGGKVEIDFHGAFVVENKPGVLLRHAYAEIKDDSFRLLAGQTWDIVSPLNPGVLGYSVLWGQGNIGYRRAQIRLERYVPLTDSRKMTLQFSVNQNIVSDFNREPGVNPESSSWPLLQGRLAITDKNPTALFGPLTVGVSGHIGKQGFDFSTVGPGPLMLPPEDDVRVTTWSFNADMKVPITERFGVQGEIFVGQNLGTFLGGIVRGVCPCTRKGIRSHGGWVDVWYDWTPNCHSHVGFSMDDPTDRDMLFGRSYNHAIFGNVSYDITKALTVGTEVSVARTSFREARVGETTPTPGESVQFEFMGRYKY